MSSKQLDTQTDDLVEPLASETDRDERFADPRTTARQLQQLFERVVQSPLQIRMVAKELAVMFYEFKDEDLSSLSAISAQPIVAIFATYITNALTFPVGCNTIGWQTVLEVVALADAYEETLRSGVIHRVIDELVDMSANDRRGCVRLRACYLMKEVLTIDAEREPEDADDEPSHGDDSFNSTQAIDSADEENIDLNDVKYPKVRKLPVMSPRTLRAMHWASLLERLRRDKDTEVRGAAIKTLSVVPKFQVFVGEHGNTAAPDDLILEHFADPNPNVRAAAIDSFQFTFKETLERAIDALDTEKDQQVSARILKRFLSTSLSNFDVPQATRFLRVIYAPRNASRFSEEWRKCLLTKWLKEINEFEAIDGKQKPYSFRPELMFKFVDPRENKELSEKIFATIVGYFREIDVGRKGSAQWMLHLRDEEMRLQEDMDMLLPEFRLTKETIAHALTNVEGSDLENLANRLFIHRNLIDYLKQTVVEEDPASVASRFLPTLCELAKAVKDCVYTCLDPLVADAEDAKQRALFEFIVVEMCTLLRQLQDTDPVGRKEWRSTLLLIVQECSFVQDRDSLASIMQDMVDSTVDSKEEALVVADQIASSIHEMLDSSHEFDDSFDIDLSCVPRCSLLLEALLRNTTINTYSTIVKHLVLRLVELATALDSTRPIGCRIVAIASCVDEQVFLANAHILATLPAELPDEAETTIACLEGIAEIVLIRGLETVAAAFYADLDPESQEDPKNLKKLLSVKVSMIGQVYEKAILSGDKTVQLAAIENGIRLMVITRSKWSRIFARCLLGAHSAGASEKAKNIIESYVNKEIGWNKNQRMFMAASLIEAVRILESWTSAEEVDLQSLLAYGLFVLRQHDEKPSRKNNATKKSKVAAEPDLVGELAFVHGMLEHCVKHPDSDNIDLICSTVSGCLSMQRYRQVLSKDTYMNPLLDAAKKAEHKLAMQGQKHESASIAKLQNRLRKLVAKPSPKKKTNGSHAESKNPDVPSKQTPVKAEKAPGIFITPTKSQARLKSQNRCKTDEPPMKSPKKEIFSQAASQGTKLSHCSFPVPTQPCTVKNEEMSVYDFNEF